MKPREPLEPIRASYCDYPRNIPLRTPHGEVLLAVTDGNHVHVDFLRPEFPLVVRGQSVWGGLHLYRQLDGMFGPDGRRFGGLVDSFEPHVGVCKAASKTTRATLLDALVRTVTAWAREYGAIFEAAARGRHEANKQAVRDEIARLEDEVRQRREELARLERGES
jgi:hypothetical protein